MQWYELAIILEGVVILALTLAGANLLVRLERVEEFVISRAALQVAPPADEGRRSVLPALRDGPDRDVVFLSSSCLACAQVADNLLKLQSATPIQIATSKDDDLDTDLEQRLASKGYSRLRLDSSLRDAGVPVAPYFVSIRRGGIERAQILHPDDVSTLLG